jgi:UDP-N-acetylmuramate dehydrogenase
MLEIYKHLQKFGHVRTNQSVAKHTTFQIGGTAQFFIEVTQNSKLIELLNFLNGEGVDFFILGGGSNTLWQDEPYEGVVIKVQTNGIRLINENINPLQIESEAGVLFSMLMNTALKQSWSGLEWAAGLPGTVGGAVRGNAGAMWSDTARSLQKVEVWRGGEVLELNPEECGFGYRDSIFKHNGDVVLRAWFKFIPGEKAKMMAEISDYLKRRAGKYPPFPSAGSFFKNIDIKEWRGLESDLLPDFIKIGKIPAGWLIDKAGLKGLTVGGCKVSNEHANFIVNFNKGTQSDIHLLIEQVKEKVYAKFSIELEPEVCII